MFGIRRKKRGLSAYLWGKHPSFRDFVEAGSPALISKAMRQWLDTNFSRQAGRIKERGFSGISWRFFIRGLERGQAAAGILMESSDSIGRAYPLLLIMEGQLAEGDSQVTGCIAALEPMWQAMEQMAAASYVRPEELHQALAALAEKTEAQSMQGPSAVGPAAGGEDNAWALEGIRAKAGGKPEPRAVFMGGAPSERRLHLVEHGLDPSDFDALFALQHHQGRGKSAG